jgi:hypothetical protein
MYGIVVDALNGHHIGQKHLLYLVACQMHVSESPAVQQVHLQEKSQNVRRN